MVHCYQLPRNPLKNKRNFQFKRIKFITWQYGISEKYQDLTNAEANRILSYGTIERFRDRINEERISSGLIGQHERERVRTGTDRLRRTSPGRIRTLSTPTGEVYGFVSDGKIYLDQSKLTPELIAEEFTHLQQQGLRLAAENGDKQAQKIIEAWDKATDRAADAFIKGAQVMHPTKQDCRMNFGQRHVKKNLQQDLINLQVRVNLLWQQDRFMKHSKTFIVMC